MNNGNGHNEFLVCRCQKAAIEAPPGANGITRYTCSACCARRWARRRRVPGFAVRLMPNAGELGLLASIR